MKITMEFDLEELEVIDAAVSKLINVLRGKAAYAASERARRDYEDGRTKEHLGPVAAEFHKHRAAVGKALLERIRDSAGAQAGWAGTFQGEEGSIDWATVNLGQGEGGEPRIVP